MIPSSLLQGSAKLEEISSLRHKLRVLSKHIETLREALGREEAAQPHDKEATFGDSPGEDATKNMNDSSQNTAKRLTHNVWGSFDNVYHAQSPKLTWSDEIRNVSRVSLHQPCAR